MKKIILTFLLGFLTFAPSALAQVEPNYPSDAHAYIFVRDDCSHCNDLKSYINENNLMDELDIRYIDIQTDSGSILFKKITSTLKTGMVTPITFLNQEVFIGYSENIVGKQLSLLAESSFDERNTYSFSSYLSASHSSTKGEVCDESGVEPCSIEEPSLMTLPVIGEIDPQKTSLSFLAISLGFVDGFNPCAMWVLLTFLLILSQVGSKKKMIQVAGLFIVAESVMYYLILNVWYQTWNFIALDAWVTPLVGLLALGSGIYFLYKYISSRNKPLVCDVASLEHQQKTESKIQKFVSKPMTFAVALGIIGLALSVNVIEFACSIGIPQAFTKILELNNLSFLEYQGYTGLYTLFYMADDIIIFGLAIWGYQKFYALGQKYSKMSMLVASVLMLALGTLLVINPQLLSF